MNKLFHHLLAKKQPDEQNFSNRTAPTENKRYPVEVSDFSTAQQPVKLEVHLSEF